MSFRSRQSLLRNRAAAEHLYDSYRGAVICLLRNFFFNRHIFYILLVLYVQHSEFVREQGTF